MIKISDLISIRYFKDLKEEDLASIAARAVEKKYSRGDNIFFEGLDCQGLYAVKEGRVKIYKTSREGREHIFYYALDGDMLSDFCIKERVLNPVSATATAPSTIYFIRKNDIKKLISLIPDFGIIIIEHLSEKIFYLTEMIEDLSFKNVPARLAKILVDMVEREGVNAGHNLLLKRTITLYEMASMAGTVREVITRSLQKLEKGGILRISRRQIEIVDLPKLKEIAQM